MTLAADARDAVRRHPFLYDALRSVLGRLATEGIAVEAAGVGDEALIVVVGRRDGPDALRAVEDALGT